MILQGRFSDSATPEETMALMGSNWDVSILHSSHSTQGIAFTPTQDINYPVSDHKLQFQGSLNATFDPPMSFRDRHRFLDGIYNSYPDPDLISAKILDGIAQQAGLSMEEVLSWFEDEKARRARLLACNFDQFPVSPPRTTTPANSTVSLTMSHYVSSPGTMSHNDDIFSPPPQKTPMRAKRGRPPKNQYLAPFNSSFPDPKRAKCSTKYPCPDCDNILAVDRWSEHVKRVHFPDQVWECPKVNQRTRKPCVSKPFFRPDNFTTHLRGEHSCGAEEISQLKTSCKFRTRNLFHQVCGFCDDTFETRDESIEHIKNHFREISERPNPPPDLGASEWRERCESDHKLRRGVHYLVQDQTEDDNSNPDADGDGDNGSGQGHSDTQPQDHFSNQQNGHPPYNPSTGDDNGPFHYDVSEYNNYQQSPTMTAESASKGPATDHISSKTSVSSPEEALLPFALPQNWNHASVEDEVTTTCPKEPSTRESTFYGSSDPACSPITHMRSGLAVDDQFPSSNTFGPEAGRVSTQDAEVEEDAQQYRPSTTDPSPYLLPRPAWPVKAGSQSPYLSSQYGFSLYTYPPPLRPSVVSRHSYSASDGNFTSDESREKSRCTYSECGKVFKDLKAHMLTHQNERPEKCPIQTCDYHIKGFARKYDKNRHTLTHYKGAMVCGFCPGSGSAAEKTFNRADVFKRHLTSVHGVEQTPPNSRKGPKRSTKKQLSDYGPEATGKCSTCDSIFSDAQDFYEHLDDCVLQIVVQEEPSEAVHPLRQAEFEQNSVHEKLSSKSLSTTTDVYLVGKDGNEGEMEDDSVEEDGWNENDADFSLRRQPSGKGLAKRNSVIGTQKKRGLRHSKGGLTLNSASEVHKNRKDYPSSWGSPTSQIKMKKRVLAVFDGPRRLRKDDMLLDTNYDVRLKLGDEKAYITDLNVQSFRNLKPLPNSDDKGPWVVEDMTDRDLEDLMSVNRG